MNICANVLSTTQEHIHYEIKVARNYLRSDAFREIRFCMLSFAINVPIIAFCFSIQAIVLPIFAILAVGFAIGHYMDHTYFHRNPPVSDYYGFWWSLFGNQFATQFYYPKKGQEELWEECNRLNDLGQLEGIEAMLWPFIQSVHEYAHDDRPAFLVIRSQADENGAFANLDQSVNVKSDNRAFMEELNKKYKLVVFDQVTSIEDIQSKLALLQNKIQHVWFMAHGTAKTMLLDENTKLTNDHLHLLTETLMEKMTADAHVILHACNTAEIIGSEENLAQKWSNLLPGRTIWAANAPPNYIDLSLNEDLTINVALKRLKSRLSYLIEKIVNVFCFRPSRKIKMRHNLTAKYVDGKLC